MKLEALEARQLLSSVAPAAARHQRPLNLLFFGNSFTLYNNLPTLVGDIAAAAGQTPPNIVTQGIAGGTLADQLALIDSDGADNVIDDSLRAGAHWNDVVIQDYSTRPTNVTAAPIDGDPTGFFHNASTLFGLVRDQSPAADGVLFETWARGAENPFYPSSFADPAVMQSQLDENYDREAKKINQAFGAGSAHVAPVGQAWQAANWAADLYSASDEYHPSPRGSMLAALVIYSTIYHQPTSRIPAGHIRPTLRQLGLTPADWQQLTALADATV